MSTRYGFMLEEHEFPWTRDVRAAIAAHPTTVPPDVVPLWSRFRRNGSGIVRPGHFELEWQLLEAIRSDGQEPVVYAETTDMQADEILAGRWDDSFRLLAARSRGAAIRMFHEGNGGPRKSDGTFAFRWSNWTPEVYIDVCRHVFPLLRAEGARTIYCMVGRHKTNDDLLLRYPGDDVVDIMAFDRFKTDQDAREPAQQWAYSIEVMGSKGKEVWVTETGVDASLSERARWITSLGRVAGVSVILIFDRLIPHLPKADDWRWSLSQSRAFDGLPR